MNKRGSRRKRPFLNRAKVVRGALLSLALPTIFLVYSHANTSAQPPVGEVPSLSVEADAPVSLVSLVLPDTNPKTNIPAMVLPTPPPTPLPAAIPNNIEAVAMEATENLIGLNDIIYQDETTTGDIDEHFNTDFATAADMEKLRDPSYLRSHFYIIDSGTGIADEDLNADEFMRADLKLNTDTTGAKILVIHTHSNEVYADSKDKSEGVMGLGERLCEILEDDYGIETMHDTAAYDVVDGQTSVLGAYERMEPDVEEILAENPSIEMVIDLHRDGLPENVRPVQDVGGKPTAQFMFFNGLCKQMADGQLQDTVGLSNPYLKTNLALSFQAQLAANKLYPGLTRKVYLKAYRYSLNMLPKSMLVEVGAQTNTKEEAFNAMEPLAKVIATVVK